MPPEVRQQFEGGSQSAQPESIDGGSGWRSDGSLEGQIHALLLILLPTCLYIHCWALLASTPQFGGTWIRIDGPIKSVRAGNLRVRVSLRNSCEAARQRERERERE